MSNLALLPSTKQCNTCRQYLPFNEFSKNSALKDKLSLYCRKCDKEKQEAKRRKTPEKQLAYARKYQAKRRESFEYRLQMLINASKQRAALKHIKHTLTLDELKSIYPTDNKCPVFGVELKFGDAGFRDNSPSIDKIDPSKGYTLDNVQVISWRANRLKADATIQELELLLSFMKQGE
jgi:hypothetical protein